MKPFLENGEVSFIKAKNKIIHITKIVSGIVGIALIFSLALSGIMINKDPDYIPSMLGHTYLNVLSDSMSPEFNVGDLVIGKKVNNSTKIEIGDIITFREGKRLVTHRVSSINDNKYTTKGDANAVEDITKVSFKNIVSVYKFNIPWIGMIIAKFQDFTFLAMIWVIAMFALIKEIVLEVKKIKKTKKEEQLVEEV